MMVLRCWCVLMVLTVVTLFVNGDELSDEKDGDRKDVVAGRGMREDFGIDQWRAVQHQPLDSSGWMASETNLDNPQPRRRLRKRKRRPQANPEVAPEEETQTRPRRRRPIRLDEARDTWKELEAETPKLTYHRRRVGPVYLPDSAGISSATISFGEETNDNSEREEKVSENKRKRLEGNERRRRPIEYEEKSESTIEYEGQTRNHEGRVVVGRRKRLRTTTTTTSTTTMPPATVVDIKNLIKQNSGMSLSEILQKKNLSLSDLLKGKQQAISALSAQSSQRHKLAENEKTEYKPDVIENQKDSDSRIEDKNTMRRVVMDAMKKHGNNKPQIVKNTPDYEEMNIDWKQNEYKPKTNNGETVNGSQKEGSYDWKRDELQGSGETDGIQNGEDQNIWGQNVESKIKQDQPEDDKNKGVYVESKNKNKIDIKEESIQIKTSEDDAKLNIDDSPLKVMLDWGYFDEEKQDSKPVMLKDDSNANWKYEDTNIEKYLLMNDESSSTQTIPKWKQTTSRKPTEEIYAKHEVYGLPKEDVRKPIEDEYAKLYSRRPIEHGHPTKDIRRPIEQGYIRQDSRRPIEHPGNAPTKVVLNWGQTISGDVIEKYLKTRTTVKPPKVMLNVDYIETELPRKNIRDWTENGQNIENIRSNGGFKEHKQKHLHQIHEDATLKYAKHFESSIHRNTKEQSSQQERVPDSTIKTNKDQTKQQEKINATLKYTKDQSKQEEKAFDPNLKYAKDHSTYQPTQQEKVFDSMNEADFDKEILEAQRKRIGILYKSNGHKIFSDVTKIDVATEPTDKRIYVPSHPKYYTSLNYKPDFNVDPILKTTTMETPTSTKVGGKPKLPVTSAKIMKNTKVKASTIPPKAIKISLSELLANKENEGPLKMLFDLEELVSNTVVPLETTSTLEPDIESTTRMQEKMHPVSAKDEIMEILKDEMTKENLEKILVSRNMTVDELVEQRERGSSQRHLADIFHNKTKEPEATMEHVAEIKVMRKGKLYQHELQPTSEIKIRPIVEIKEKGNLQEISDVSMSSEELITSERIPGTSFPTYKIENKHKQNPIPIWKTIYNTKEKQFPVIEEIENTISEAVNEELTKDNDPITDYDEYVQLPLGVKSAIFASLAIIAISIVVFLTILIIFKWAQQQKQRLCYPGTFKSPILQSEARKSIRTFVSETLGRKRSVYTSRLQSMSDSWDSDKPYQ